MPEFNFNSNQVPTPRPLQPLQQPSGGSDAASIILQAAQLQRQDEKLKQESQNQLFDVIMSAAELQERRRRADIEEAANKALLQFREASIKQDKEISDQKLGLLSRDLDIKERALGLGGRGALPAEEVNRIFGYEVFPPGSMVSTQQQALARFKAGQEKPPTRAQNQLDAIRDAVGFIETMRSKRDALSKQGKTGFVRGGAAKIAAGVSGGEFSPEVGAYEDLRKGLAGRLKGVAGEEGRITDQDIKRIVGIIPSASSADKKADILFDEAVSILRKGESTILEKYPAAARRQGTIKADDSKASLADRAKQLLRQRRGSGKSK